MQSKLLYLPGLNGLRAFAAITVVTAHCIASSINLFGLAFYYALPMAQFSVTLFFVISGFLISYLLLIEKESGKINVKKFYLRRILRIWPLYYLYITICVVINLFSSNFENILSLHICWYIFFVANLSFIFNHIIYIFSHLWSLGLEEQFYAFWPWVMKRKNNELVTIIIIAIFSLSSLKVMAYFILGRQSQIYILLTVLRFQSMMLGALGAIWYYKTNSLFIRVTSNRFLQVTCWVTFFLTGLGLVHIPSLVVHELISVISVLLILGQINKQNQLINLENNICRFLGGISYGVYIIHLLCIELLLPLLKPLPISPLSKTIIGFGIVMIATIILAYLSYTFYESFFLKLKDRFTTVKTKTSNLPITETEYAIP